jgi:hypothetical protein
MGRNRRNKEKNIQTRKKSGNNLHKLDKKKALYGLKHTKKKTVRLSEGKKFPRARLYALSSTISA